MMTTCVCHVNPRSPYALMNKNKNIHFRCHCPFLSIEFGARARSCIGAHSLIDFVHLNHSDSVALSSLTNLADMGINLISNGTKQTNEKS